MCIPMKIGCVAVLLSLLLALTACGPAEQDSTLSGQSQPTPETFGTAEIDSTPEQMAQTTQSAQSAQSQVEAEPVKPSSFTDLDRAAVVSVLVSQAVDGQPYDRLSSGYFWRAVGYLAGHGGAALTDGKAELTEAQLQPLVAALFGPYSEQYPSLSEEDPLVTAEYVDDAYHYTVSSTEPFDYTVELGGPEPQPDGTYTCQATLLEGGQTLGDYTLTLTTYAGEDGGYSYSILGLREQ